MSIFDFFKKKDSGEAVEIEKETDNLVIDMYSLVCKKCQYGEAVEKLNLQNANSIETA